MQRQGGRWERWGWLTAAPALRANAAGEQTRQEDGGTFGSPQPASGAGAAADHDIPGVFLLESCKAVALRSFQQKEGLFQSLALGLRTGKLISPSSISAEISLRFVFSGKEIWRNKCYV